MLGRGKLQCVRPRWITGVKPTISARSDKPRAYAGGRTHFSVLSFCVKAAAVKAVPWREFLILENAGANGSGKEPGGRACT